MATESEEANSVKMYLEKDSLQVSALVGDHLLIVDEPEKYGGTAEGPDPYAYLLTALGSCSAMTMRMYADRKKWPLTTIEIILSHKKVYPEDCRDCEKPEAKLDHIFRQIHLDGDLSEEQRKGSWTLQINARFTKRLVQALLSSLNTKNL